VYCHKIRAVYCGQKILTRCLEYHCLLSASQQKTAVCDCWISCLVFIFVSRENPWTESTWMSWLWKIRITLGDCYFYSVDLSWPGCSLYRWVFSQIFCREYSVQPSPDRSENHFTEYRLQKTQARLISISVSRPGRELVKSQSCNHEDELRQKACTNSCSHGRFCSFGVWCKFMFTFG